MYIKRIRLENYRGYKNETFEFLPNGYKEGYNNLSLIEGLERSGKTTIFNAIGWCLYGLETSLLLGEPEQDLGIPNDNVLKEKNQANVSVELDIGIPEHPEIDRVVVKRSEFFGRSVSQGQKIECYVYYKIGQPQNFSTERNERQEIDNIIETILPRELVEFYMFNGEYLVRAYKSKGKDLENGIKKQFKIGAISYMIGKLREIEREYRNAAAKGSSSEKYSQAIDQIDLELKETIEEIEKANKEILEYSNKAEKSQLIKESLKEEYGLIKGKEEYLKRKDELKGKKEEIEKELDAERKNWYELTIKHSYRIISKNELEESLKKTKEYSGGVKLPPDISESFINDLLSRGTCICGNPLLPGTKEYERVSLLKEIGKESSKNEILLYLIPTLESLIRSSNDYKNSIFNSRNHFDEYRTQKDQIENEIKQLSILHSDLSSEEGKILKEYENAEIDYKNFKRLEDEKNKYLQNLISKKQNLEAQKERLNESLRKELQNDAKKEKLRKNGEVAGYLADALEDLKDGLFRSFIDKLEKKSNEIFKSIDKVSSLSASISYAGGSLIFNYLDKSTINDKAYISQGQNQIISICLMAAFTKVLENLGGGSTVIPFVIMDHPFSNLSSEGKNIMSSYLGELFKNVQIIMMVPKGEMQPIADAVNKNSTYIASIFKVNFDPNSKKSWKEEVRQV
jgi:DNA sulfur modification protein DndD